MVYIYEVACGIIMTWLLDGDQTAWREGGGPPGGSPTVDIPKGAQLLEYVLPIFISLALLLVIVAPPSSSAAPPRVSSIGCHRVSFNHATALQGVHFHIHVVHSNGAAAAATAAVTGRDWGAAAPALSAGLGTLCGRASSAVLLPPRERGAGAVVCGVCVLRVCVLLGAAPYAHLDSTWQLSI